MTQQRGSVRALAVDKAAQHLGVSESLVRELADDGVLQRVPHQRVEAVTVDSVRDARSRLRKEAAEALRAAARAQSRSS